MVSRILPALLVCFALSTGMAQAQFSSAADPTVAPLEFGKKNVQLKTILALQNQLQILHRLIDHENAVNHMIDAAVSVGISNPAIQAPDKELCAEVPANIPCAQSYASLYSDFSVEKKPAYVPPPVVAIAAVDQEKPQKHEKLKAKPEPEAPAVPVYWSDITCLGSKCSAVISDNPMDPKASYRISPGETLPDGSVISAISAAGVSIMRNKKLVQLDPAPQV
jgi:hypothetical protein